MGTETPVMRKSCFHARSTMKGIPVKLAITLAIGEYLNLPWPEGVPLPNIGDEIIFLTPDGSRAGVLTSRAFGIGIDPRTGDPATTLQLKAA